MWMPALRAACHFATCLHPPLCLLSHRMRGYMVMSYMHLFTGMEQQKKVLVLNSNF